MIKQLFGCLQLLSIFKKLHRVRQRAFKNDNHGLSVCRERINEGFRKNKNVSDEAEIYKLFKTAEEVETVMKTQLVQLEQVEEKTFSKSPNQSVDFSVGLSQP